ncbi:MAG: hypothetical protein ACR2OR_12155 [Hyphomicrobiales bacterium]
MLSALKLIGQAVFLAAIVAFIGYFSANPVYRQTPEGLAQIKLSFAHGAQRTKECRRLTPQEIAKLPPNERRPHTCDRERLPIHIQLVVDGDILFDELLQPTGLSNDGPARTYKKFLVPAGKHTISARLTDSNRSDGFDFETDHTVTLKPWQNLAIDFKADTGGFSFR